MSRGQVINSSRFLQTLDQSQIHRIDSIKDTTTVVLAKKLSSFIYSAVLIELEHVWFFWVGERSSGEELAGSIHDGDASF